MPFACSIAMRDSRAVCNWVATTWPSWIACLQHTDRGDVGHGLGDVLVFVAQSAGPVREEVQRADPVEAKAHRDARRDSSPASRACDPNFGQRSPASFATVLMVMRPSR